MDGETSSMDGSIIHECHPWMEKPHPWMKMTDMEGAIGIPFLCLSICDQNIDFLDNKH